jgi:hypothetical protein
MMDERREAKAGKERRRFIAALGLFFLWVVALAVTAISSGRRPDPGPSALEGR